ncbi:MAG: BREX-3 system phosphatase PglZ [Alphaproteobacteria bacterium]|nr:BREX-3 system phosphatase PglZ [Alphaproteobacteria bacterium]
MSAWSDRILNEFTPDISRLWIASDPDGVLLDERLLAGLRERGFDLLPFEDSIAFRAEYDARYRSEWGRGEVGPSKALILLLRSTNISELPWDYLKNARRVSLTLADLFPMLSYPVIRQIDPECFDDLYSVQNRHAPQILGESATKDFVLTHIFKFNPHLIRRSEDLWREILQLHYRNSSLPYILAEYVTQVLSDVSDFQSLPLKELFTSKAVVLRIIQGAWRLYLAGHGVCEAGEAKIPLNALSNNQKIPFEHPDIRVIISTMFYEGSLHPLVASDLSPALPDWVRIGVVQDPLTMLNLVRDGIHGISQTLPNSSASFRDWISVAQKFGELLARFYTLTSSHAMELEPAMKELQFAADNAIQQWVGKHYADLASLPASKAPVMVHHIPRYLSMRRLSCDDRTALLVFDGLAIDQWVQIRDALAKRNPKIVCEENACFAWAPTLTSVSRQSIFSGMKPREFANSIDSTGAEPAQWSRFWQDQGLRVGEIFYRKGLKHNDQLDDLAAAVTNPNTKVIGLVIDTVDEIVHGAVLGKRGIASQISGWVDSGFVEQLLDLLLCKGFDVYLTADHGNVDATGQGRPKQGVAAELRGERVRIYRNEELAAETSISAANAYHINMTGLPEGFLPIYAGGRTAFINQGDHAVVHGGISLEELLVPFVKLNYVS